jgi:hypothetical protein
LGGYQRGNVEPILRVKRVQGRRLGRQSTRERVPRDDERIPVAVRRRAGHGQRVGTSVVAVPAVTVSSFIARTGRRTAPFPVFTRPVHMFYQGGVRLRSEAHGVTVREKCDMVGRNTDTE